MIKTSIYEGVNRLSSSGGYVSINFEILSHASPVLEFLADSVEISRSIVELTTFKVTTNVNNFNFMNDFPIVKNKNYYVEVEEDGKIIVTGMLYETNINILDGQITFDCNDMLYLLNYTAAVPNTIVNNKTALAGFYSILKNISIPGPTTGNNQYAYWEITRFHSIFSKSTATRIDLRDEKSILAQLQKISESVPKFYFRYGGNKLVHYGGGLFAVVHSIECGVFNESTGLQYNEKNIDEFNIRIPNEPRATGFYGYGWEYKTGTPATTPQIVMASDKSTYGSIISPYIIDAPNNFTYESSVTNFDYDQKYLTFYYKEIQPDTLENPTATERQQAGDTVYGKGITEIKESQGDTEIEISSSEFSTDIMPGNTVELAYSHFMSKYNAMTGQANTKKIEAFSLNNATYYIKSYTMSISQEERNISYVLQSTNDFKRDASQEKILISLGRQLRESGEYFLVTSPMHNIGYYSYNIPLSTANNYNSGGFDWYKFTVNKTADWLLGDIRPIPTGASVVAYFALDLDGKSVVHNLTSSGYIEQFYKENDFIIDTQNGIKTVNNGRYIANFVVVPTTAGATFEIAVRPSGGSWTTSDTLDLTAIVVFEV
jgi:hypothetical protein